MYNTVGKNGGGFADFYNHFNCGKGGGNILGVRGADSDRNTTHVQTPIESCYQINT